MSGADALSPPAPGTPDRLPFGVAARLARYLQVLTQAAKMGRTTIASQELATHTHVGSTQIRRDLSGLGRFGTRGVGYDVDALIAEIRDVLRASRAVNIVVLGAGHLGRAIAGGDAFADHGFDIVTVLDNDPAKIGTTVGDVPVGDVRHLEQVVRDHDVVVAVLACPARAAQPLADECVRAGVQVLFDYSGTLLRTPPGVVVHSSSPAADLVHALYFYLS